ncbi:hypothetical protein ACSBR1_010943 [Camellia fascicularis]
MPSKKRKLAPQLSSPLQRFYWWNSHTTVFLFSSLHSIWFVWFREELRVHSRTHWRHSVNRPPTPDARDEQQKDTTLEEIINIKLSESGEKERLMELLRERLMECGWKDEMKALCRAFIKKKGGDNVTVDDLVHVITPKGRASIPDPIKAELLQRIRTFLVSAAH